MLLTAPDGHRIGYDDLGSRHGPALVLLPGTTGARSMWERTGYVEAFRSIARVLPMDLVGRGESDRPHEPAAYGIPRHARDVLHLLDVLGIDRATVWGHSMGGRIGFELAASHPDRVVALIATGATGHGMTPYQAWLVHNDVPRLRAEGMARVVDAWASFIDVPDWMRQDYLASDPLALAASIEANAAWPGVEDRFESIGVPVLLLIGEREPIIDQAREAAARVRRCVLAELEGLDHIGAFTRSDVACAIALEWLRGLWAPQGVSPGGDNPVEK